MAPRKEKVIVITGATRGLGRALVDAFIARGHMVAGCGRSNSRIRELTRTIGPPHRFTVVDVSLDHQVKAWVRGLLPEYGAPDYLLNNAGMMNQPAALWQVPAAEFSRIVDVNIKGPANTIRHFLPSMLQRKRGVIVNFSSAWGRSTSPDVAPYCTTKWAIEGMTKALAEELPNGVAAVSFNPGIINTEMLQTCWGRGADDFPSAQEWAEKAAPFILQLGPKHNGKSVTAP